MNLRDELDLMHSAAEERRCACEAAHQGLGDAIGRLSVVVAELAGKIAALEAAVRDLDQRKADRVLTATVTAPKVL